MEDAGSISVAVKENTTGKMTYRPQRDGAGLLESGGQTPGSGNCNDQGLEVDVGCCNTETFHWSKELSTGTIRKNL